MTAGVPVEVTLRNEVAELERLRPVLARFLESQGLLKEGDSLLHDLDLCLEEIITNIIKYAYDEPGPREIRVRLRRDPAAVVTEVEDDGNPFNPLEHPRPDLEMDLAKVEPGGLGILLVREYMDRLDYRWQGRRNCLIMTRALG